MSTWWRSFSGRWSGGRTEVRALTLESKSVLPARRILRTILNDDCPTFRRLGTLLVTVRVQPR